MMNRDKAPEADLPQADEPERADATGENPSPPGERSGRVQFDDRGNAIWEWAIATGAFGRDVSSQRLHKLEHPALSIADDGPPAGATVPANPLGTKKGYDPYDSGRLGKAAQPRTKTDLRKLSEWLKLRKQAEENKKDE